MGYFTGYFFAPISIIVVRWLFRRFEQGASSLTRLCIGLTG